MAILAVCWQPPVEFWLPALHFSRIGDQEGAILDPAFETQKLFEKAALDLYMGNEYRVQISIESLMTQFKLNQIMKFEHLKMGRLTQTFGLMFAVVMLCN